MNFKLFEEGIAGKNPNGEPIYVREPQGTLRKSAAVKQWKVGVGKSGDGYGVYTLDDIADNELIEECVAIELPIDDIKGTVLTDYIFKLSNSLYALALGNGSLYNHRNQPNARWEYDNDRKLIKIFSTRAITMGEEIFISYGKEYFNSRQQNMKS
jgi:hypothetical protein